MIRKLIKLFEDRKKVQPHIMFEKLKLLKRGQDREEEILLTLDTF